MLQSLRDGAQSKIIKFCLFGLLALAGLGLVMSDIGGFFRGNTAPTVAFEIDGDPYSTMELDRRVTQILQTQGLGLEQAFNMGLVDQIIDSEINTRLLKKEGIDLGVRVSDAIVAEDTRTLIDSVLGTYGSKGATRESIFFNFIQNLGMSEQQYVYAKKAEITSNLLTDALTKTNSTPEIIGKFLNAYENEKRVAETSLIKSDTIPAPTAEQLEAFYESSKEVHRKPEYRNFSVAVLKYDDVRDGISISDEMLKKEYEDNIDAYTNPEVRTLVQAHADDEETAKKIYEAAKKDGDIKKAILAVKSNDDGFLPSSDFTKAQLPQDIGTAAFAAKVGEVSAPVKSDLGWFVMKVEKSIPAKSKPLSEVSKDLKKELQDAAAADALYKIANQFEDGVASGTSLKDMAKELNIPVVEYSSITAIGKSKDGKNFGGTNDVLKAAFETFENETSHMIENNNGDVSFVSVDKIEESFIPALADIKSKVEDDYIKLEKLKSSREKAEKVIADLKAGKKPVEFKTHSAVSRESQGVDGLDAVAVSSLFQIENKGEYITIPQGTDHLVIGLKEIKMDLKTASNEEKSSLDMEFRNDLMAQYFNELRKQSNVKVTEDISRTIFKPRFEQEQ